MQDGSSAALAVHPDRVRAAYDPRLSDATVSRLLSCRRSRDRIESAVSVGASAAEAPPDGYAWLLDDPAGAARRAGAGLHARALRNVLSGPQVAALIQAIGREAHAFGLRHAAEAAPRALDGELAEAILRDGFACLAVWLATQPAALRAAVLLRLPPGTPAEAETADAEISRRADALMARVRDTASANDV
ncbi:nodulation protein NolU [Methylobacterium brachythecii]|uniref:Nodulation protein NolU n=1 Tax=Methylobacterium brachythecii TaxID=1176177 RepID=A0A7W6AP68_9HYPH|nr:nodulation protein NolU [Methylobacterium brachythecii]MBB3903302.1 hypothetical protein [Methylobacterium brachythecii]